MATGNYQIPMTLLRRGTKTYKDQAMQQAFPGTGYSATRRDMTQFNTGRIISWNLGVLNVGTNLQITGSDTVGI